MKDNPDSSKTSDLSTAATKSVSASDPPATSV